MSVCLLLVRPSPPVPPTFAPFLHMPLALCAAQLPASCDRQVTGVWVCPWFAAADESREDQEAAYGEGRREEDGVGIRRRDNKWPVKADRHRTHSFVVASERPVQTFIASCAGFPTEINLSTASPRGTLLRPTFLDAAVLPPPSAAQTTPLLAVHECSGRCR